MSFIEIDSAKFDIVADVEAVPVELQVVRAAWGLLVKFGVPETIEVEKETRPEDITIETFGALNTPTLDALMRERCLSFDQLPIIDGEPRPEPGLMTFKITNPAKADKVERQIIFRLETHRHGPGVFYGTLSDEARVTDEDELEVLSLKLDLIEKMYWHVAKDLGDAALMHIMPQSEVEAELRELLADPAD